MSMVLCLQEVLVSVVSVSTGGTSVCGACVYRWY